MAKSKTWKEQLLEEANCDLKNNDPMNVLSRCCLDFFFSLNQFYITLIHMPQTL